MRPLYRRPIRLAKGETNSETRVEECLLFFNLRHISKVFLAYRFLSQMETTRHRRRGPFPLFAFPFAGKPMIYSQAPVSNVMVLELLLQIATKERRLKMRRVREKGAAGYIALWALGVPASVLVLVFLLRGCT
jgi:hypothetical protein